MKISQWPQKGINFLKEVRAELKRVSWLTRRETIKYTVIVIGVIFVLAAFLGSLDFFFAWILGKLVV